MWQTRIFLKMAGSGKKGKIERENREQIESNDRWNVTTAHTNYKTTLLDITRSKTFYRCSEKLK